jgi:hypothetical protein
VAHLDRVDDEAVDDEGVVRHRPSCGLMVVLVWLLPLVVRFSPIAQAAAAALAGRRLGLGVARERTNCVCELRIWPAQLKLPPVRGAARREEGGRAAWPTRLPLHTLPSPFLLSSPTLQATMGRRAKNKQAPPQEFATAAAAAPSQAKRKADGYVPRSGGKKLKLGPDGKKIRKAPAPKPVGLVAPGAAKAAKGKGKAKDEDEDELLCVRSSWAGTRRSDRSARWTIFLPETHSAGSGARRWAQL